VIHPTNNVLLPSDEAPGQCCVSKLLGITMEELWAVLLECKLAKKKGSPNVIEKEQIKKFMCSSQSSIAVESRRHLWSYVHWRHVSMESPTCLRLIWR
jgi:hypothetical protein